MRHQKCYIILICLLTLIVTEAPGWAMGKLLKLDEFKGSSLNCSKAALTSTSGKPSEYFEIELYGSCSKGPTSLGVLYYGSYDYSTHRAKERVTHNGDTILEHSVICSKNPWVKPSCDWDTRKVVVKVYNFIPDSIPLSAHLQLGEDLRNSLAQWETSQSNEELLADWSPMEQPTGPAGITIKAPFYHQVIDPNSNSIHLVLQKNSGFEEATNFKMYLERLEKAPEVSGDIAMPEGKTHMWQPTSSGQDDVLHSFNTLNKTYDITGEIGGIPGYYKVRVVGTKVKADYSGFENVGELTPWRFFCVGANENCPTKFTESNQSRKIKEFSKQENGSGQFKKGGGFVPRSDEKIILTKQGESSLGPEGLKTQKMQEDKTVVKNGKMETRSGDVKLFDGSGSVQQDPGGSPALKIISPINLQTVNVNADGIFYIGAKTNPGFEFPNIVRLHFERKEEIPKGTEVAIPDKGATHWWETVLVNNWGWPVKDAPIPVSESTPGFYRVRIRGLTHGGHDDIGGWTPWRYFCIGSNENCPTTLKTAKGFEKQVAELEKGGGFGPQRKDMKVQIESPLVTSGNITVTLGGSKRKMKTSSDIAQKSKVKTRVATTQVPKPNIIVQSISPTTPKGRKQGEPFYEGEGTMLEISFENIGKAKSDKNHKYTISCNVKSGGPECPVKNKTKFIAREIKPNNRALISLSATLNKAGEYHVTVKVTGEGSAYQKTVKLNVVKKLKIQPKSKAKTMRTVPVVK